MSASALQAYFNLTGNETEVSPDPTSVKTDTRGPRDLPEDGCNSHVTNVKVSSSHLV